jgi:hypothetical protein
VKHDVNQKKMQEETAKAEAWERNSKDIRKFCKKWKLKVDERLETLIFIGEMLNGNDDMRALIEAPLASGEDAEIRQRVLKYLEKSAQSMEEIADELTRLSKETRDEKARLIAGLQ